MKNAKEIFKSIWNYIKHKWLFLLIVAGLILANAWIWDKVTTDLPLETFVNIALTLALVYVAYRQYRLGVINKKIALFDKRWAIYTEIINFIDYCLETRDSTESFPIKVVQKFLDNTKPAVFLFNNDKDLLNYIQTLWQKGILIRGGNIHYEKDEQQKTISLHAVDDEDIKLWFINQRYTVDQMFEKYLKIEE